MGDPPSSPRSTCSRKLNDYDPAKIRVWEQERAAVINFGFLSEANTYAYRQQKVSMASVLDHRFGEIRDQGHAWQAAIDEKAMVFTNHPVTDTAQSTVWADDGEPGYWTGEAAMPRSAQYQGTAVHIYQPKWDESTDPLVWGVFEYRSYTHAYVPQDHFDEVRQVGNWTIAARSAPTSHCGRGGRRPARIRPGGGGDQRDDQAFDLVAEGGPDNVWLVEVGSDDGGTLDDFVALVTAGDRRSYATTPASPCRGRRRRRGSSTSPAPARS